jgi:hypothetical protein
VTAKGPCGERQGPEGRSRQEDAKLIHDCRHDRENPSRLPEVMAKLERDPDRVPKRSRRQSNGLPTPFGPKKPCLPSRAIAEARRAHRPPFKNYTADDRFLFPKASTIF